MTANPSHVSASLGSPPEQLVEHHRVRQRRVRAPARIALSMTSMIDIVFLLLVYFLVATDFRMGEEIYRMDLPDRRGMSQQDPFTLNDEPLRIGVASTGLGADMYRLSVEGPYPQPKTFQALFEFLRDRQVNPINPGSTALFPPDHPIVIQPVRSTRWEHAIEALNAAARARYTNVTFAKAN